MSYYQTCAIPKPTPRWKDKVKKLKESKHAERECWALVDKRDMNCCRVCRKRVGGIGMLEARHRHHLVYRSKGGETDSKNLVTLCVVCHQAVHDGEIRLSGDADQRNQIGVLNGVHLERATEFGWRTEGWR